MTRLRFLAAGLLLATAIPTAVTAHPPIAADQAAANFEQDRADILAMAGNYKVRFDMQEATRWDPSYTPLAAKISGGHEVVRVIEDTGRKIVLQHMLVAEHEGETFVIKHWRQDWQYEPEKLLVYADTNRWEWEAVPERMRTGRWSQTVWQVDDSPRYGGWGQFETQGGIRRWRSNWTWRPLARRDAVRDPVYDRYLAINRHQNGPEGWIHWQDNMKMAEKDGKLVPSSRNMSSTATPSSTIIMSRPPTIIGRRRRTIGPPCARNGPASPRPRVGSSSKNRPIPAPSSAAACLKWPTRCRTSS